MSEENGENRKLTLIHEMEFELNWSQLNLQDVEFEFERQENTFTELQFQRH